MMLSASVGLLPLRLHPLVVFAFLMFTCGMERLVTMTICHHNALWAFGPQVYSERNYVCIVRTIIKFISSSSTDAVLCL